MKKKKIILVILIGAIVSGIVLLYSSYALFSSNQISKSAITIKVGMMNGTIKIDNVTSSELVIPSNSSKTYTVTLENNNGTTGKFLLFYLGVLHDNLKLGYTTKLDIPPDENGIVLAKGESKKYLIKVENNTSSSQTIKLGTLGGLSNQPLNLPSDGHLFSKWQEDTLVDVLVKKANGKNIVTYASGIKTESYTFVHEKGVQQDSWTTDDLTSYRFIGSNPNNYAYFNCQDESDVSTCEVWRIIGVFTVEDENGNKEKRVKLLRSDYIGYYSYDGKKNTGSSDGVYGSNEWSDSYIRPVLNDSYYHRTTGTCYVAAKAGIDSNVIEKSCDFTTTGLKENARNMIKKAKFYLGGSISSNIEKMYLDERGVSVYTKKERSTNIVDSVGLLYASDYGYTFAKGVDDTCIIDTTNCNDKGNPTNSWMYQLFLTRAQDKDYMLVRTITPVSTSGYLLYHVRLGNLLGNGAVHMIDGYPIPSSYHAIYPVIYLKPNVTTPKGTGASSDPYQLSIDE